MTRLLDLVFPRENIGPPGGVLLQRWIVCKAPSSRRGIYIHRFIRSEGRDPHDHPKVFSSIGITSRYWQAVYDPTHLDAPPVIQEWRAPYHIHRIHLDVDGRPRWTLVITGARTRRWGFHVHKLDAPPEATRESATRGYRWVPEKIFHRQENARRRAASQRRKDPACDGRRPHRRPPPTPSTRAPSSSN